MAENKEDLVNNQSKAEGKIPTNEPALEKEVTKKKEKKKVSVLDTFISSKTELSRYSIAQGFRIFCSRNFKAYKEFKTKEDCEAAFKKYYLSVGK